MIEGMREASKSIWYQLGYALETARHGSQSALGVRSVKKAQPAENGRSTRRSAPRSARRSAPEARSAGKVRGKAADPERRPVSSAVDQLIATGTGLRGARPFPTYAGRAPAARR